MAFAAAKTMRYVLRGAAANHLSGQSLGVSSLKRLSVRGLPSGAPVGSAGRSRSCKCANLHKASACQAARHDGRRKVFATQRPNSPLDNLGYLWLPSFDLHLSAVSSPEEVESLQASETVRSDLGVADFYLCHLCELANVWTVNLGSFAPAVQK